jgi:hypothetical protein
MFAFLRKVSACLLRVSLESLNISRQFDRVSFNNALQAYLTILDVCASPICRAPRQGRVLGPFAKSRVNPLPLDNHTLQFPAF